MCSIKLMISTVTNTEGAVGDSVIFPHNRELFSCDSSVSARFPLSNIVNLALFMMVLCLGYTALFFSQLFQPLVENQYSCRVCADAKIHFNNRLSAEIFVTVHCNKPQRLIGLPHCQ